MASLLYLLGAIAATVVIVSVLYVRNRKPQTMESGIDSFRRELQALSPERTVDEHEEHRSG